jgi:hypothetical protein
MKTMGTSRSLYWRNDDQNPFTLKTTTMKRKLLYLFVFLFCMSALASSEECIKHTKEITHCNMEGSKSVKDAGKLVSGAEKFELTPVSLLLFEI